MIQQSILYLLGTVMLFACYQPQEQGIKYELHSKNKKILEIQAKDIAFYDTTQSRRDIEIHELRLKDSFFEKDSFVLNPPIEIYCKINGNIYFKSNFFEKNQVHPKPWVNFKFRTSCKDHWEYQEQKYDTLIFRPSNRCNSIEFLHMKNYLHNNQQYFSTKYKQYQKTAEYQKYQHNGRLAHEILLDSFYIQALRDAGVPIK